VGIGDRGGRTGRGKEEAGELYGEMETCRALDRLPLFPRGMGEFGGWGDREERGKKRMR